MTKEEENRRAEENQRSWVERQRDQAEAEQWERRQQELREEAERRARTY